MTKARILVVDDNWPVGKLVAARLEKTGRYEVRVEYRPSEVLDAARDFCPQIFLLDLEMPGKNGLDLARELRCAPEFANTPILFLTLLLSSEEAAEREWIDGSYRYLSKSAPVDVFEQYITRALTEHAHSAN